MPEYFCSYPVAPAAMDLTMASFSLEAVSISTLVSGSSSLISRQASMPSITGMITSMTITSGADSRTSRTAFLAVRRLGHHLELPRVLQGVLKQVPHDLVVVNQHDAGPGLGSHILPSSEIAARHDAGHGGPAAVPVGLHLENPAHSLGIGPHVPEPVAPGLVVLRQPHAVVGHRQSQFLAVAVETNDHVVGTGVADYVGQGVVSDGEEQAPLNGGQRRLPSPLHQFRRQRGDDGESGSVGVQYLAQLFSPKYLPSVDGVPQLTLC